MKTLEYLRMPCRFAVFFLLTCTLGSPALSNDDPGYFGFGVTNNMMLPSRATGRNAAKVVVNNEREFVNACNQNKPLIIEVSKSLDFSPAQFNSKVNIKGNKVIRPVKSPDGEFVFVNLRGSLYIIGPNVIIERLSIEGKADGITINKDEARNIVIYKCDIFNCGDGYVDITGGASHVTIAYCKFWRWSKAYSSKGFIIYSKKGKDTFVTMHHNWFGRGIGTRVPQVAGSDGGFANVHLVNNYWAGKPEGRQAGMRLRRKSNVFAEGSVFQGTKNPWLYDNLEDSDFDPNPDAKSHFRMTDTKFQRELEKNKEGVQENISWNKAMENFANKKIANSKSGKKLNTQDWTMFTPKEYTGKRFIFYNYEKLSSKKVQAHVERHAGTKFPRTKRTGPVKPPTSPQSVTSRQQS